MKRNPRVVEDLAKELNCRPEEIISYRPTPEALSRECGTCRYFQGYDICDIGDGKPMKTTEDTHSCGMYQQENRVCTSGAGFFCTGDCKTCDAFKCTD